MTQNTKYVDHSPLFSTKAVRKAIQSLGPVLCRTNVDAIIYDLENYALPLTHDHITYSLAQIQSAFKKKFGNEAALHFFGVLRKIVFKQIIKNRQELFSSVARKLMRKAGNSELFAISYRATSRNEFAGLRADGAVKEYLNRTKLRARFMEKIVG